MRVFEPILKKLGFFVLVIDIVIPIVISIVIVIIILTLITMCSINCTLISSSFNSKVEV